MTMQKIIFNFSGLKSNFQSQTFYSTSYLEKSRGLFNFEGVIEDQSSSVLQLQLILDQLEILNMNIAYTE